VKVGLGGASVMGIALFSLSTPNLRTLEVERFNMSEKRNSADANLFVAMINCLVRNKETLRGLKLDRMLTNGHHE